MQRAFQFDARQLLAADLLIAAIGQYQSAFLQKRKCANCRLLKP
jgi:hypothetical protein